LQLSTPYALYSDDKFYPPAVKFIKAVNNFLPEVNRVLVLGTGLASIIKVINNKGYYPDFTLVEINEEILYWAIEFSESKQHAKIKPVCMDAQEFMQHHYEQYDLIFIDIFNGRVVPDFVTDKSFLQKCKACLSKNGYVGFNYIINDNSTWERDSVTFNEVFPENEIISFDPNKVFISRNR